MTLDQSQSSPNSERLRIAMGWDRLPLMSPQERAEFEAEQRRFDEEIRRFYGKTAS